MPEKLNILITGVGFLGSVLVEQLLNDPELDIEKITILDNFLFKEDSILPILRHPKIDVVIGDVRDKELLISLLKGKNLIIPTAAYVGGPICERYPKEAWEVNRDQIINIANNIEPNTKLIYFCTNSIYGFSNEIVTEDSPKNYLSIYAKSKGEAENYVLDKGFCSLRLSTLFGVSYRQRIDLLVNTILYKSLSDGYIILYEPTFERCYISVNDAARATIHAIKNYETFKGQAFNVGNTKLNCNKLQLAQKVKEFVPNFVIHVDDYNKDPDQRKYIVSNSKLESTGFKCAEDFDITFPSILKCFRTLQYVKNEGMT